MSTRRRRPSTLTRAAACLLMTPIALACTMPNPAFGDLVSGGGSETGASTGSSSGESATSGGPGSTADASANPSGSGSASDSGVDPGATSSGSESTSTSGVGSSTSGAIGTSSTGEPETTGPDCPDPCDGGAMCQDGEPPTAFNCFNGCGASEPCEPGQECALVDEIATCFTPEAGDCAAIANAYAVVVDNPLNKLCLFDGNCQAVAGSCAIEGGECWHALNKSVSSLLLQGLGDTWIEHQCVANCDCQGLMPPLVTCENGQCVFVE
ncbi:MAG: hypothetical protein H6713_38420 [Myxococcales bacterium]|nr:hypothetical protein [Myxococcales bacterium]MCB9755843.1 hypothetical protein [Myxococcales bacterium]